ncbi:hypothetical protein CYMTET_19806 [Cymbomonas tetramitiformis]|uniref:Nucleotide-diphospho-sugar transferase domain-containing protein n=1 Tax=Cymbomonas tetramitiformis TaxID=36881 RepID=A0AAE0G597_9CHLO|nr:hypothetical protein CYMTET_19806 [Cymbomonas tetramitiformis]
MSSQRLRLEGIRTSSLYMACAPDGSLSRIAPAAILILTFVYIVVKDQISPIARSASSVSIAQPSDWRPTANVNISSFEQEHDPLYQSAQRVALFYGDLAIEGAMEEMIRLRTFQSEIIAVYSSTGAHLGMSLNLVGNLHALGLDHYILVMGTEDECHTAHDRSSGLLQACVWQSGPAGPADPYRKPLKGAELGTRHYFIWRLLQHGINTLWLDTDTHLVKNPYPYFKSALAKVNLIMKPHDIHRIEINTGIMYAQGAAPEGPVTHIFRDTYLRFNEGDQMLADHSGKVFNRHGVDVSKGIAFEQQLLTDVIESNLLTCNETRRMTMKDHELSSPGAVALLLSAMKQDSAIQLGCDLGGIREVFKSAADTEFGWKEYVYSAMEEAYQLAAGAATANGTEYLNRLRDKLPYIVHVRDQGGQAWEKEWRFAQLGWWNTSLDRLAVFGDAFELVLQRQLGKVLQLENIAKLELETVEQLMDVLETFAKLALHAQRVPIFPELPCELGRLATPPPCEAPHCANADPSGVDLSLE